MLMGSSQSRLASRFGQRRRAGRVGLAEQRLPVSSSTTTCSSAGQPERTLSRMAP